MSPIFERGLRQKAKKHKTSRDQIHHLYLDLSGEAYEHLVRWYEGSDEPSLADFVCKILRRIGNRSPVGWELHRVHLIDGRIVPIPLAEGIASSGPPASGWSVVAPSGFWSALAAARPQDPIDLLVLPARGPEAVDRDAKPGDPE